MGESALENLIVAIIGEGVTTVCDGKSVVDVIRWARKPGKVYNDSLHIEIWLNDSTYKDAVLQYIKTAIHKTYPTIKIQESRK